MFKKLFMMLLVVGLLTLGSKAWAANYGGTNNCGWTNLKFAEFLAKQYGIKPIVGSVHERYQALANALSQKGINCFSNTKPNDKLTCCGAADALYAVVGTKEGAADSCDLKIDYLVRNGLLKLPASAEGPCDALCDVEDTFTGVEKFRPPHLGAPPIHPPHRHPDNPSSRH
jgi:hypothetical protein